VKILRLIVLAVMFIVTICILQVFAGTTGKIAGVVVDSENKQPIPARTTMGANVSPIDGSYVILNVPPGTYTLVAECIGYNKLTYTDLLIRIDVTTERNFELVSEAIRIEDITVVAERPVIDKYEVSTVDRISSEEILSLPVIVLFHRAEPCMCVVRVPVNWHLSMMVF